MEVRPATVDDAVAINALYNCYVDTTMVAWTEAHEDLVVRQEWLRAQEAAGHPVLVAVGEAGVVGFASYSDFRDSKKWPGYRFTVEHTIYVDRSCHRQGVGRALLIELLERAEGAGKHVMIGAVDGGNEGSIAFHGRFGFREVGRVREVGFKFGTWLDLVLMERILRRSR